MLKTIMKMPAHAREQKPITKRYVFHSGHLPTRLRTCLVEPERTLAWVGEDVEVGVGMMYCGGCYFNQTLTQGFGSPVLVMLEGLLKTETLMLVLSSEHGDRA